MQSLLITPALYRSLTSSTKTHKRRAVANSARKLTLILFSTWILFMNIVVKIYIPKVNFIMVFVIFNIDCFLEENSFATDFNILFFLWTGWKISSVLRLFGLWRTRYVVVPLKASPAAGLQRLLWGGTELNHYLWTPRIDPMPT